jgi:serine/threonine protein kinase
MCYTTEKGGEAMTISELRANYRRLTALSAEHGVYLVQEISTGGLLVEKELTVFSKSVYSYLLSHPVPNTPRLYTLVEDGDRLIILEEYLSGMPLDQLLETQGPLGEDQVLDLGQQLCTILEALHSAVPPIIHRDIKPGNLLLSPDGKLKLLDMNAAKWHQAQANRDTRLIGTAGYAAPEQYGFGSSGPETDLYAVGVVLNELLTGALPGESLAQGKLRPIIQRCCRMDPKDRYHSVSQLRSALDELSANAPKSARTYLPPGFRNRQVLPCMLSALGYFLLIGLGLSLSPTVVNTFDLWLNRVFFTLAMLAVVFFSGNYLGCQARLPLSRSKHPAVHLLGIILWDVVFLFAAAGITGFLEALLFPGS